MPLPQQGRYLLTRNCCACVSKHMNEFAASNRLYSIIVLQQMNIPELGVSVTGCLSLKIERLWTWSLSVPRAEQNWLNRLKFASPQ